MTAQVPILAGQGDEPVPGNTSHSQPPPAYLRYVLPRLGDLVFVALFVSYVFTPLSAGLLYDAGMGWHIRNGDYILATGSVPRVDHFSYTMAGRPWFAWEWLYDVLLSAVHSLAGLEGIVVLSAFIIALTFKLLYEAALRSSGSLLAAAVLVVLAGRASAVHFLARPHLISWLFTLFFLLCLERFRAGKPRSLWWLPAIMLLWVNLHGGYVMGFVLVAVYLADQAWTLLTAAAAETRAEARTGAKQLAMALTACLLATFANPYGYELHVHVWRYLTDSYLMNHIEEFASPNFHDKAAQSFELLILLSLAAVIFSPRARSFCALLLMAVAIHASLFAVRNLPISSLILAVAVAPALGDALRRSPAYSGFGAATRRWFGRLQGFSDRMAAVESQLSGNALPALVVLVTLLLLANHGQFLSMPVLKAGFDPQHMPVKAVDFIQQRGIRENLATPDGWSGYLIYRLYPDFHVYMDDRHDFYGSDFIRDYIKLIYVNWDWQTVIEKHSIRWVLVGPNAPLASILKQTAGWHVAYDDGVAILFERQEPSPADAAAPGGS